MIARRYHAGIRNMRQLYLPIADEFSIYDNTDGAGALVASKLEGVEMSVHDAARWALIEEAAR